MLVKKYFLSNYSVLPENKLFLMIDTSHKTGICEYSDI